MAQWPSAVTACDLFNRLTQLNNFCNFNSAEYT